MIITKTPYRISLFGGGTDHPAWYRENGGEVISFAIDKYCYLTTRVLPPFFDHKYRIAYSKVETTNTIDEIQHPAVRGALKKYCPDLSLEIHHDGDLPARSGVGSSSAFAVGLIHSLLILKNKEISIDKLANEAIHLEQIELNENVGSQDQIACATGGLNYIRFGGDKEWDLEPVIISNLKKHEIENRTVLIYTGVNRSSSDVQANLLIGLNQKTKTMQRTIELARECRDLLLSDSNLDEIGEMLAESWSLKKAMNSHAITPDLEEIWHKSQRAGALGGKVLGAGGGGFCMFWVREGGREDFLEKLKFGTHVPIRISNEGSSCILNS
jgi:D-glycero-alpha-D-manno-heptose-7-phosphate kinase